ncbi:Dystonin [Camelus dromedarius]|uniref:Dystonin n=1 Tax=Camelus dromedarius TaxID=9838 RepID=A0A5N4CRD3_CAMDR|nr:Dystonin [Camelus dromedarius]
MISGLISPESRKCFGLEDAESHGLIDEQILSRLQELNETKEIISAVPSSSTLPVLEALAEGVISEPTAVRILDMLLSTGCLVSPATGEQLTLQKAFQQRLVSSALFSKVLERQNTSQDLIDPSTAEKLSLGAMMQRSILQENTGVRLLPVRPQEGGRVTLKGGRSVSVLRAAHEGLIDRETVFRLLGAQLLSGGLIGGTSGQRLTVEEAVAEGLMDRDMANSILTYQVETGGIIRSSPAKRLTVDEAVQCDLITPSSALLVLEAQRGYVGLIWPHSGEIFPTSSSLQQELITNELAYKILDGRQKIAALYIPETSQVLDLDVAMELGIIDHGTAAILKSIILPDQMPDLGDVEACRNARRWLSFCKFQPSMVQDYRQEEDVFEGEEPVETQSSEQTKKLFLSYLMINSYMDANTGQRLLLYDGDLDEAVGMLLEGCAAEFDEDMPGKERPDVLRHPGVFLNNASGQEMDEGAASPSSLEKCPRREPQHQEIPENRKHVIDGEFHEMGSNAIRSEFGQSENPAGMIAADPKVQNSSSVCVPRLGSDLIQPRLAGVSVLRPGSENILKNGEKQSPMETQEHAGECGHSKNVQNFAGDLITSPMVEAKTSRICDLNEMETEDNISRGPAIFDYSPRLSALLSHDKLRTEQRSLRDVHATGSSGNKREASSLPFKDQTTLLDPGMGDKFQDEFLGIAAINISLQGEHAVQKSLNLASSHPQGQHQDDQYGSDTYGEGEKVLAASQDKWPESAVEEDPCAMTPGGGGDHVSLARTGPSVLGELASTSAGDYETSLLVGRQSDTETDSDSEDDFYDTPLSEDDDHDSLLLEGDDRDGLQPEDCDILGEEDDGPAPPGEVFYDVAKGSEHSMGVQGAVGSLQDFLIGAEKAEPDSGERRHFHSVGLSEMNGPAMETVSERDSTHSLQGAESDSWTDHNVVGREGSFRAALKPEDAGCWREEESVTGQEFRSDTDHLESVQSEESYGDPLCDSNDLENSDDYDDDGGDTEDEGAGGEDGQPACQDQADHTDVQARATAALEEEDGHGSQRRSEVILPHKKHDQSSLEKQPSVNVLWLESSRQSSSVMERSSLPEYTTEAVQKSKENLWNHEVVLKDTLLPVVKAAESENNSGPIGVRSIASGLDGDRKNAGARLTRVPGSAEPVKGSGPDFEKVPLATDPSSDEIISPEPGFLGNPAEEGRLSPIVSVTDRGHHGSGGDPIRERDDKTGTLMEEEASICKMGVDKGEVLLEGPVEDDKYLQPLPRESTRESLDLVSSQFPHPQITESEHQKGSIKKATVAFEDEPKNLPTVVSQSPVQFENLEEIFESAASHGISDEIAPDVTVSEGSPSIEKDSFTDGPEEELDLFAFLNHCARNVKAEAGWKPNEDAPGCFPIAPPPPKDHLQLGVKDAKEKAALVQEASPPNEMVQWKDLCSKESISEGGTGIPEFTPEIDESTPSVLPLGSVGGFGKHADSVPSELCTSGIINSNSRDTLSTGYSSLEINNEEEIIAQQPRTERASSPGLQENEVPSPELSPVFVEDVKDILQDRLRDGHLNPQEAGDPSAHADTKILIKNLMKRVSTAQLINEASDIPGDSETRDYSVVSPMNNSPELKTGSRDDPRWTADLKSELLLDVLKQNQCGQKTPGAFELMKELTQMECEPEERGVTSTGLRLHLESIFSTLLADGCSERVGQFGDLNQKSPTGSGMVDEKPHTLDDLPSKGRDQCPLHLQNVRGGGPGNPPVGASAQPGDKRLGDPCPESPDHLECASGSKEMASGDSSMEQFASELQQCLQHTSKMSQYLALLQDMKPPLDNQESPDSNLEALKNQLKQLETFELGLAPMAVILRKDMKLTEDFLKSLPGDFPRGPLKELSMSLQSLETAFSSLRATSSERMNRITLAIDSETNVLKDLGHSKTQLETTAFDVQFFISEHAQDLSPTQSKQLLRLLNTTQKCFLDVRESVTTQVEHLETQLQLEQALDDQKVCLSLWSWNALLLVLRCETCGVDTKAHG